ncbi:HD domain-containing protein [Patescibacteria group bacterium]|nr:HD domain-containing protein [Patescibacteria group bacterium]
MIITDRVYGKIEINEPVLLELMQSFPLERLKGINQAGASQYALNKPINRYEHSVGVMILLKILGAPLEEQIAGLLHDVPHTAFSHVIDYVFENEDHEFHEKFHEEIIKKSDIPGILKKYNFDLDRLLDENNFPLLERKLPDLCADRIDYALRDRVGYLKEGERVASYIADFVTVNNEIVFSKPDIALYFAKDFLDMDYRVWSAPLEIALFQILANAIKIALAENIISKDDLFEDDKFVYDKLKNSANQQVLDLLAKLNPKLVIDFDKNNYDFFSKNKLRFVDPKFVDTDGNLKRVTERFPEFIDDLKKHEDWTLGGHYIKIKSW